MEPEALKASCAAHSKQIIEGRLNRQYPATIEHTLIGGVPADVVTPRSGITERNRNRVLINLHGGGFIGKCPDGLVEAMPIAGTGGIRVITVDYREAPEAKFPAASEDVTAVYRELLKSYVPENIGIYGCSAGGALAGQATAWIITQHLPPPGAIGHFLRRLGGVGRRLDVHGAISAVEPHGRRLASHDLYDGHRHVRPDAVPGQSPRTARQISAGAVRHCHLAIVAMSNALYSHNQLAKAGVESELRVWDGLWHSFMLDDLPEAKEANRLIVHSLRRAPWPRCAEAVVRRGACGRLTRSDQMLARRRRSLRRRVCAAARRLPQFFLRKGHETTDSPGRSRA